jgi:hypothetical protein
MPPRCPTASSRRVGPRHPRVPHPASGGLEAWDDEPALRTPTVDELLGRTCRARQAPHVDGVEGLTPSALN